VGSGSASRRTPGSDRPGGTGPGPGPSRAVPLPGCGPGGAGAGRPGPPGRHRGGVDRPQRRRQVDPGAGVAGTWSAGWAPCSRTPSTRS
jgi:translation initiation factor IF-2